MLNKQKYQSINQSIKTRGECEIQKLLIQFREVYIIMYELIQEEVCLDCRTSAGVPPAGSYQLIPNSTRWTTNL